MEDAKRFVEVIGAVIEAKMPQECLGKEKQGCNLMMMSRRARLEDVFKRGADLKMQLATAKTPETVNEVLDKIASFAEELENVVSYESLSVLLMTIDHVKCHNDTRYTLGDVFKVCLDMLQDEIAAEKKKEQVAEKKKEIAEKLKIVFLELAEHSEEVAEKIDLNEIIG